MCYGTAVPQRSSSGYRIIRLREGFAEVRFLVDKDESEHEQIGFKPGTLFTSAKPSLARMMTPSKTTAAPISPGLE
jgi:hypothetical protein